MKCEIRNAKFEIEEVFRIAKNIYYMRTAEDVGPYGGDGLRTAEDVGPYKQIVFAQMRQKSKKLPKQADVVLGECKLS